MWSTPTKTAPTEKIQNYHFRASTHFLPSIYPMLQEYCLSLIDPLTSSGDGNKCPHRTVCPLTCPPPPVPTNHNVSGSHIDAQASWIDGRGSLMKGWVIALPGQVCSRIPFVSGVRDKEPKCRCDTLLEFTTPFIAA